MPIIDAGEEGQSGFLKGSLRGTYTAISDRIYENEGYPPALRVVFSLVDKADTAASLYVPLTTAATSALEGFVAGQAPSEEGALRDHIEQGIVRDTVWLNVYGKIDHRLAPPGTHRFKLHSLRKFTRKSDSMPRVRFDVKTKDGLFAWFTCKYPALQTVMGKTPNEDSIGDANAFAPKQYLFRYLMAFGLDWKRFTKGPNSELAQAPALWDRLSGDDILGILGSPDDITPGLLQALARHTAHEARFVEMEIIDDLERGLIPKAGDYARIFMTPIIVESSTEDSSAEFQKTVVWATELLDNLTKVLTARDNARYTTHAGGGFTEDGKIMARQILVPVVRANPQLVRMQPEDETAMVRPFEPASWVHDGVACLGFLAERLLAAQVAETINLVDPAGIADSKHPEKIVQWASENVAEIAMVGKEQAL